LSETADRTYSAALADIDGDGDLDIIVSNDNPDKKLIYKNDGKGHYLLSGTFGDPNWSTRYITVADVHGDNRPDILVANRGSIPDDPRPSQLCLNDGHGAFPTSAALPTQSATIIVAKDFDGDGFVDLLIPHRDGGQNLIFWNDGKANFVKPAFFGPTHSSIRTAAAADLNGDGKVDVVFGDEKEGVFLCLNKGNREFTSPLRLAPKTITPYAIGLADMDKDGHIDVIVGNVESPGSVFFNKSDDREVRFNEIHWGDGKGTVYELPSETLTAMVGPTLLPLALTPPTLFGSTTRNSGFKQSRYRPVTTADLIHPLGAPTFQCVSLQSQFFATLQTPSRGGGPASRPKSMRTSTQTTREYRFSRRPKLLEEL
jgi:hypothetical protein